MLIAIIRKQALSARSFYKHRLLQKRAAVPASSSPRTQPYPQKKNPKSKKDATPRSLVAGLRPNSFSENSTRKGFHSLFYLENAEYKPCHFMPLPCCAISC